MSEHESPAAVPTGRTGPRARHRARQKAVQALYQQLMNRTPLDALESQFMDEPDILKADLDYFRLLVRGVSAAENTLDEQIAPLTSRPLAELDPVEHAVLRLGCYELLHCLDVPAPVVINEAIEMAKRFGATDGHKFVNGVLDRLAPSLRPGEGNARRG
ncbi:MAG: transcription antitermination factor NusB [Pseudomonadota bacterium]